MIVGIETKFDAAHYLPGYKGKCANMHGHTWHVEVEVIGSVDEKSGMVYDLTELKSNVNFIIERFDHRIINELFPFEDKPPTCENLAMFIFDELIAYYNVQSVKVREGEGGWART